MLDSATKQVAKPILCDTYTLIHIKQGSHIAFPNNLRELHKIKQYTVMTTRLTLLLSQGSSPPAFYDNIKEFLLSSYGTYVYLAVGRSYSIYLNVNIASP